MKSDQVGPLYHDKHFCILSFGCGLTQEKSDQENDSNQILKDHCVLFVTHSFTEDKVYSVQAEYRNEHKQ